MRADLPGVEAKDIQVTADNGVLTIRGERHFEKREPQQAGFERFERVARFDVAHRDRCIGTVRRCVERGDDAARAFDHRGGATHDDARGPSIGLDHGSLRKRIG